MRQKSLSERTVVHLCNCLQFGSCTDALLAALNTQITSAWITLNYSSHLQSVLRPHGSHVIEGNEMPPPTRYSRRILIRNWALHWRGDLFSLINHKILQQFGLPKFATRLETNDQRTRTWMMQLPFAKELRKANRSSIAPNISFGAFRRSSLVKKT